MTWQAIPHDLKVMVVLLLVVLAVITVLAVMWCRAMPPSPWPRLHKAAWRTFRSIGAVDSGQPSSSQGLNGETAVVLQREVSPPEHRFRDKYPWSRTVDLHLYVRSREGQGFYVIARSDGTSTIRTISEGSLKAVLKDQYQPPVGKPA